MASLCRLGYYTEIQRDVVLPLVDMQRKLQVRIQELSGTLEMLYENEVQRLLQNQSSCEALCANDKSKLNDEIGISSVF